MPADTYTFEYKVYYTTNPDTIEKFTFDLTLKDPCAVNNLVPTESPDDQWTPSSHVYHEDDIFAISNRNRKSFVKFPRLVTVPAVDASCKIEIEYKCEGIDYTPDANFKTAANVMNCNLFEIGYSEAAGYGQVFGFG